MLRNTVFIGPIPPPLGGVAVVNQNYQDLVYHGFLNSCFNTSNNNLTEDLYKGFPWSNLFKEIKKAIKFKRHIETKKPDIANVFVTSGYSILRDLYYLRILKKHNIPVIVHFHSKKHGEFALKKNRLKVVAKLFKKNASKIVLLSQDHFNYFTNFFDPHQCMIIENFVDYSAFDNVIDEKTNEFLFVGRLSKQKGFFDLLEALVHLKNKAISIKVHVLGAAPTELDNEKIDKFIETHNLSKYLIFHGLLYGEEKYLLFKTSKVLLFPSHFENSPVVLKEAIAAKMAIISSDIEANKLILEGKENTVFHKAQSPVSLANSIKNLIKNGKKINELCKASSKILDYDKSYAQAKLEAIMNDICGIK